MQNQRNGDSLIRVLFFFFFFWVRGRGRGGAGILCSLDQSVSIFIENC